MAKSPSSWADDYFDWLKIEGCCKEFPENSTFCPHDRSGCVKCAYDRSQLRPSAEEFRKYLPYFLTDNPDANCAKAGHASYAAVTHEFL